MKKNTRGYIPSRQEAKHSTTEHYDAFTQLIEEVKYDHLLDAEKEHELFCKFKDDGCMKSREDLIRYNIALCVNIASKATKKLATDVQTLTCYGIEGLIAAIDKFDHTKCNDNGTPIRLSTYATWWIRQSVDRLGSDETRGIRVPMAVYGMRVFASMRRGEYAAEHGENMPDVELLKVIQAEYTRRQKLANNDQFEIHPQVLFHIMGGGVSALTYESEYDSLAQTNGEETDSWSILDQDSYQFDDEVDDAKGIQFMLGEANLNEKERFVVVERFGLEGSANEGEGTTLEVVGGDYMYQRYGRAITRERVRQIEASGLKKLKAFLSRPDNISKYGDMIKAFLPNS